MNKVKKAIRTGSAIGKVFSSSKPDRSDVRVAGRWFRRKRLDPASVRDILDLENIAAGIQAGNEIDTATAWHRLEERIREKNQPVAVVYRRSFHKLAYAFGAAVVLAILLFGGFWHRDSVKEAKVMEAISAIRPKADMPTLYLEDGTVIPIQSDSREMLQIGLELDENSKTLSYKFSQGQRAEYNTLSIPKGRNFRVLLPDGTEVWLNANSTLRYFTGNPVNERRVYLEGEAFFNVARDEARPFIVVSDDHEIKVLGTQFNVTAYAGERMKYTTLVKGKVEVRMQQNDDMPSIVLDGPGEQSIYYKSGKESISERQVDPEVYTAWMNGVFHFSNTSLEDIMFRLSQWYGFSYFIGPEVRDYKFSGSFDHFEDLGKVLDILRKTGIGFSIDYIDGQIIIEH